MQKKTMLNIFWILEQDQYMALTTAGGGLTVQLRMVSR